MPKRTVFYSWQTDLPNSINRGFIGNCLTKALEQLAQSEADLELDPAPDRDTRGIPGSPDIAATIFSKVDRASVFVGDVSIIHPPCDPEGPRRTPNPNVLLELGYAAHCHGWDCIVCVLNEATGTVAELPFDLRHRRTIQYRLEEEQDRAEQRKILTGRLASEILQILRRSSREEVEERRELFRRLAGLLAELLIYATEHDERSVNPWLDELMTFYRDAAGWLRDMATSDAARREELDAELHSLAGRLDLVGGMHLTMGNAHELREAIGSAADTVRELKRRRVDSDPDIPMSAREMEGSVVQLDRKLEDLVRRSASLIDRPGGLEEIQREATAHGKELLEIAHVGAGIVPELAVKLMAVGRDLHLVDTVRLNRGMASEQQVLNVLKRGAEQIAAIARELRG